MDDDVATNGSEVGAEANQLANQKKGFLLRRRLEA